MRIRMSARWSDAAEATQPGPLRRVHLCSRRVRVWLVRSSVCALGILRSVHHRLRDRDADIVGALRCDRHPGGEERRAEATEESGRVEWGGARAKAGV